MFYVEPPDGVDELPPPTILLVFVITLSIQLILLYPLLFL